MAASSPRRTPTSTSSLGSLPQEVVQEIFVRVPLGDVKTFARLAAVCKLFKRILARSSFLFWHLDFHGISPVMGYLFNGGPDAQFVTASASSASSVPPLPEAGLSLLDSHHGRALFHKVADTWEVAPTLLVWDFFSDEHRDLALPTGFAFDHMNWTGTVFCNISGCDHHHCYGGPFTVAVLGVTEEREASAFLFSSEVGGLGRWELIASATMDHEDTPLKLPAVVLGKTCIFRTHDQRLIRLDFGADERIRLFDLPRSLERPRGTALMPGAGGGVRFAAMFDGLLIRSWEVDLTSSPSSWIEKPPIKLTIPPHSRSALSVTSGIIGYSERPIGVLISTTGTAALRLELDSLCLRWVPIPRRANMAIPVTRFFPRPSYFGMDGSRLRALVADEPGFERTMQAYFALVNGDGGGVVTRVELRRVLTTFCVPDGPDGARLTFAEIPPISGVVLVRPPVPSEITDFIERVLTKLGPIHGGSLDCREFITEVRLLLSEAAEMLDSDPLLLTTDPDGHCYFLTSASPPPSQ